MILPRHSNLPWLALWKFNYHGRSLTKDFRQLFMLTRIDKWMFFNGYGWKSEEPLKSSMELPLWTQSSSGSGSGLRIFISPQNNVYCSSQNIALIYTILILFFTEKCALKSKAMDNSFHCAIANFCNGKSLMRIKVRFKGKLWPIL